MDKSALRSFNENVEKPAITIVLTQIGAAVCLVLGLATVWTPIPVGLPLIALGLGLLLTTSRRFVAFVGGLRFRNPGLSAWLRRAEPYLPSRMRAALEKTRRTPLGGRRVRVDVDGTQDTR